MEAVRALPCTFFDASDNLKEVFFYVSFPIFHPPAGIGWHHCRYLRRLDFATANPAVSGGTVPDCRGHDGAALSLPGSYLAPLPPVICNAVIVGAEIAWFFPEGMSFWAAYGLNAFTVGIGELAVCCLLGLPLLKWAERTPALLKRV